MTGLFESTTGSGTINIWPSWNQQWTLGTTTAATTVITNNASVWQGWNQNQRFAVNSFTTTQATSSFILQQTWGAWNTIFISGGTTVTGAAYTGAPPRKRTAEEKAADAARHLREEEERKKAALEATAAKVRARKLLFDFLSDEQRVEVERFKRFHLTTRSGRRFRIHTDRGRHGNVKELEGDREVRSYCIAPNDHTIPDDDALLAQKLALDHDETEFLRIANMTRVA